MDKLYVTVFMKPCNRLAEVRADTYASGIGTAVRFLFPSIQELLFSKLKFANLKKKY
jgi:hypothetical protein